MNAKLYTLLLVFLTQNLYAQCELKTKRITVFKDATAFIEKEGTCEIIENQIIIKGYPNGLTPLNPKQNRYAKDYSSNQIILGTLNIKAPGNNILYASMEKFPTMLEINSLSGILGANKGKNIKIRLKTTKEMIEGELFSIEKNQDFETVILKKGAIWEMIKLEEIASFEFTEIPKTENEFHKKRFVVKVAKETDDQIVEMSYLQKGITWMPNYSIQLLDDNNLQLNLSASIANDIEEMENVELNLVVGVPVFEYSKIGDPLFSNQSVQSFLNSLSGSKEVDYGPAMNLNIRGSRTSNNSKNKKSEDEGKEDLFIYQFEDIDLRKNGRMTIPTMEMKAKYEDVFVIELTPNEEIINYRRKQKKEKLNLVWHAVKFKNQSDNPLTTGTVFFKKKDGSRITPLSQGNLNYTPKGENALVKMSISPNILVNDSDVEINREEDAKRGDDLITVEGTIEVSNLKNEAIKMEINREILGTLVNSSLNWETFKITKNLNELNEMNQVKWKFELKSGEKKTVKYKYKVYVD